MNIRDRVKELRRVKASELLPNERNWRTHPTAQADALRGLLAEIGYAGALLAYETPAGLKLIDGHLRAETTPDCLVPVLVLDVNDAEAAKILATHDPLGAMATADAGRLDDLLKEVTTGSDAVQSLLDQLASDNPLLSDEPEPAPDQSNSLTDQFNVLVVCRSEQEQGDLLQRLTAEGLECRSLIS